MQPSTERFSSRVENYTRYRPSYPSAVLDLLTSECGLIPQSIIADVGSGTGILSKFLLDNGNLVYGIEPNKEMREEAERNLADYPNFKSIAATAEATTLSASRIDFVTAGQAFHWFDAEVARTEFVRILQPDGWVALIWNTRRTSSTPFLQAYEELLRTYTDDYLKVRHNRPDQDKGTDMLISWGFQTATFEYTQSFDYESLKGRLLSSSYAPEAGHPKHLPMLQKLREIFDQYNINNQIAFDYDTQVFYGRSREISIE